MAIGKNIISIIQMMFTFNKQLLKNIISIAYILIDYLIL